MSTLLSMLFNTHALAVAVGYATGAWSFPKIAAKLTVAETAAKAVEQDVKKL